MNDFFDDIRIEDKTVEEVETTNSGFRFFIKVGLFENENPYTPEITAKLLNRNIGAIILSNSEINIIHIKHFEMSDGTAKIDLLVDGEFRCTTDCLTFIWSIMSIFFKYKDGHMGTVKISYIRNEDYQNGTRNFGDFIFYSTFGQLVIMSNETICHNFIKCVKFLISDAEKFNKAEIVHFVNSKLPSCNSIHNSHMWFRTTCKSIKKEEHKDIIGNVRLVMKPDDQENVFSIALKNLIQRKKVMFSGLDDLINHQKEKRIELNVCVEHTNEDKTDTIVFNPYICNIIALRSDNPDFIPNSVSAFFNNYKKLINIKNSEVLKTLDLFNQEFIIFNNTYSDCSETCPVFSIVFYMGAVCDEETNENFSISVCVSGTPKYLKHALEDLFK